MTDLVSNELSGLSSTGPGVGSGWKGLPFGFHTCVWGGEAGAPLVGGLDWWFGALNNEPARGKVRNIRMTTSYSTDATGVDVVRVLRLPPNRVT